MVVYYLEDVVNIILLAPLHERVEHEDDLLHLELPRAEESEQVVIVVLRVLSDVVVLDILFELLQRPLLLFTHVSHETKNIDTG